MLLVSEEVDHQIGWHVRATNSSFWFDNWTKQGTLFFVDGEKATEEEIEVKGFVKEGRWNVDKLREILSEEMAAFICTYFKLMIRDLNNKACWLESSSREFSVKSAFQLMRHRKEEVPWARFIWVRGLPSKISFFMWRVMRRCIPTNDNVQRLNVHLVSKCYCCESEIGRL